jgi:hypothetical protein
MEGRLRAYPISDIPYQATGFGDQGLSDQVGFKRANSHWSVISSKPDQLHALSYQVNRAWYIETQSHKQ